MTIAITIASIWLAFNIAVTVWRDLATRSPRHTAGTRKKERQVPCA